MFWNTSDLQKINSDVPKLYCIFKLFFHLRTSWDSLENYLNWNPPIFFLKKQQRFRKYFNKKMDIIWCPNIPKGIRHLLSITTIPICVIIFNTEETGPWLINIEIYSFKKASDDVEDTKGRHKSYHKKWLLDDIPTYCYKLHELGIHHSVNIPCVLLGPDLWVI